MEARKIEGRYYQKDALENLLFSWTEHDRVLLRLATGAGKTILGSLAIKGLLPSKCLWVADSNELCYQPLKAISNVSGVIPALEKSDSYASLTASVVVASAQTLCKQNRLDRFPRNHFKYIFGDEVHRGCERNESIYNYFSESKVCGFTATPFRTDMADLSKYFEHIAYSMPMVDLANPLNGLIGQGFAPPWKIKTLPVEIDLDGTGITRTPDGKEYNSEQVNDKIEPYYHQIAELYKEHAKGRKGVAFLVLKASSEKFAGICREHGIKAMHVAGDSPDRDEILARAARGEYDLLCNAGVISTGVDIPILDCFLNLRPTKSLSWYQQAAGRVCRTLPGVIDDLPHREQSEERKARIAASAKPDALILDVLWQHDMLGVAHPGHLVAGNEEEAKAINEKASKYKSERDLIELAARVLEAREKSLKEALERAALAAKKKLVPAEHVPTLINDAALIEYQPAALWEMEPPTEAQIEWLTERHIDCENLESRGFAKKLMDALSFRGRFGFATPKMLRAMKRLHLELPNMETLTIKAAGAILKREYDKRKNESKKKTHETAGFLL